MFFVSIPLAENTFIFSANRRDFPFVKLVIKYHICCLTKRCSSQGEEPHRAGGRKGKEVCNWVISNLK